MTEISRSFDYFPESKKEEITFLSQEENKKQKPTTAVDFQDLDEKTRQMLKILIHEEYKGARAIGNMRLKLVVWVLRNNIGSKVKRLFDIGFALFCMILFSPVILVTSVAIFLDSGWPIIYKQVRVGKGGKQFDCLKFRSMVVDADRMKSEIMHQNEADEIVFKIRKDPRITRVGRIIRKLSIDELPQILNVLKGDMSFVGPRPCLPSELEYYQYDHFYRLDAIPGITGLQQVSGRSDIPFKRWVELDLEYIQKQSIWKDFMILVKTIPVVIFGKGAY